MTQTAGRYPILVDPALLFLRHRDPLAVSGATYYHGCVIALDSQGRGAKATGAAGLKIVGFYDGETFTAVSTDRVSVSNGVIPMLNSSTDPVTIADLKNVVFLESDDTIARTSAGGTLSPCGILELYEDSTPKVQIGGLPPAIIGPSSGSLLLHAPVADQTAMQAIAANDRADGMLCVDLTTNLVWQFDTGSSAGASAWVRVPAAGTGRWLRTNAALTDLASVATGYGASLVNIEDAGTLFTATTVEGALAEAKTLIDAGMPVLKKTVTVGQADLTDADGSQTINIGTALPANARIVGVDLRSYTPFTGGTIIDFTVDIGTAGDIDALIDGADLFAAAVDGGPATIPQGIRPNKTMGAAQLIATFVCGSDDVANATAGAITIDVLYTVLA